MARVIVSLTTTAARAPIAQYTVLSLLHQEPPADVVRLNLSREPYLQDDGLREAPAWLCQPPFDRVDVHWVPNTGPYRKLLPTIVDATHDDLVVTTDDDVIYQPAWLRSLIETAERHPDKVVCGRAVRMTTNALGRTTSYLHFRKVGGDDVVGHDLLPTGISGVVYRRRLLDLDFLLSERFRELAPTQDDIWFRFASLRQGVPVVIDQRARKLTNNIATRASLYDVNVHGAPSARRRSGPATRIGRHIIQLALGYLGAPVVPNDFALRRVRAYSDSLPLSGTHHESSRQHRRER